MRRRRSAIPSPPPGPPVPPREASAPPPPPGPAPPRLPGPPLPVPAPPAPPPIPTPRSVAPTPERPVPLPLLPAGITKIPRASASDCAGKDAGARLASSGVWSASGARAARRGTLSGACPSPMGPAGAPSSFFAPPEGGRAAVGTAGISRSESGPGPGLATDASEAFSPGADATAVLVFFPRGVGAGGFGETSCAVRVSFSDGLIATALISVTRRARSVAGGLLAGPTARTRTPKSRAWTRPEAASHRGHCPPPLTPFRSCGCSTLWTFTLPAVSDQPSARTLPTDRSDNSARAPGSREPPGTGRPGCSPACRRRSACGAHRPDREP